MNQNITSPETPEEKGVKPLPISHCIDPETMRLREPPLKTVEQVWQSIRNSPEHGKVGRLKSHALRLERELTAAQPETVQLVAELEKIRERTCCLCGGEVLYAVEKAQVVSGFVMHCKCYEEKGNAQLSQLRAELEKVKVEVEELQEMIVQRDDELQQLRAMEVDHARLQQRLAVAEEAVAIVEHLNKHAHKIEVRYGNEFKILYSSLLSNWKYPIDALRSALRRHGVEDVTQRPLNQNDCFGGESVVAKCQDTGWTSPPAQGATEAPSPTSDTDILHGNPTLPLPPESQWQPIETAPKDGTRVLTWNGDKITVSWWVDTNFCVSSNPTHWQPLPPPPAQGKE